MNRLVTGTTFKLTFINLFVLFISCTLVFAQGSNQLATDKNVKSTKPWANIEGFRSAKFRMSMHQVKKAIYKDFGLRDNKITTMKHPIACRI